MEARRLRHALESYYAGEGRGDPVRIEIPKGRYAAEFTRVAKGAWIRLRETRPVGPGGGAAVREPER